MISPGKIIVIGGNAAGPSAAAKAKRVNPDSDVLMIEKGPFISTGTCEMPYVLSGEIDDVRKIVFFDERSFEEKKGVRVLCNTTVREIDRRRKEIRVVDESGVSVFQYDKLIIATGSSARDIPKISTASNYSSLKNVSDLLGILKRFETGKINNITVVGAGYIGLETAEALSKLGKEVTLLELSDTPLPGAEPEIRILVEDLLKRENVQFIGNAGKAEFLLNSGGVKAVKYDGRIRDVDFVIGAAGFEPNISLAKKTGIEIGPTGAIKVDSKMKTSDPNIFAAGDCAEVIEYITGRPRFMPFATYAHESGHVAGENAAGGNAYFKPKIKNAAVKIFDSVFTTVGLTEAEAKENRITVKCVSASAPNLVKIVPGSSNVFGKINYDENSGNILGASFFGQKETIGYADMISVMIKSKSKADSLSGMDFNYTPPMSPFVHLLSVLGRKINKEN